MPDMPAQAGPEADLPQDIEGERYLICTNLGEYYAFPSRYISEIALFDKVFPLPLLPGYVLGIINRYSVPYVLMDIGLLISKQPSSRAKVLVIKEPVKAPGALDPETLDKIAFLIDDVIDIVEIPRTEVLPIEGEGEGVIESSFSWKGKGVFVLDVRRIINRAVEDSAA
ncbi:MAG: chemotaxis protein CheW [Treponema sp.]|jgi:purine-binding chemotaxis protein CheW|nr:chemotaxis protein CheW [Treponema sp.]